MSEMNKFSALRTFEQAADELLNLVNSYMGGKMIFVGKLTSQAFSILKLQNHGAACALAEGQTVPLQNSVCQLVFESKKPVLIEDTQAHPAASCIPIVPEANIGSYLGVPIFRQSGEVFGTLCAVDDEASQFTVKDVQTFEGLARFFSYVLEIEERGQHDQLTGIPNRISLEQYMVEAGHLSSEEKHQLMILYLDLDNFKNVNDTMGHHVGDILLEQVAKRLKGTLRAHELMYRLGGDEFLVVLKTAANPVEEGTVVANRIIRVLNQPFDIADQKLQIGCSVGGAAWSDDSLHLSEVIQRADQALYHVKRSGRNQVAFYESVLADSFPPVQ